jgi:short-subunit dehydrogenase
VRWRNAVVTGASSGIGAALAEQLAASGIEVVLCARRTDALEAIATRIRSAGGTARVLRLDLADPDAAVATLRALDAELEIDLLVANAGAGLSAGDPLSWEAMREACEVNFAGAVATLTAVLPRMIARGRGHLVGVSSLASFGSLPGSAAYCAPKAGLSMFLDCLRLDLRGTGVGVTTVHPGFVRTPMLDGATHAMPQLVEVDAAARLLVRRLASRPARIDFPQPLAWAARLAGGLPRVLHDLVVRLFGVRRA